MPPIKELHYFDRLGKHPRKKNRFSRHVLRRARAYLPFEGKNGFDPNIRWDINFFLKKPTYKLYPSLFMPGPNQIAGEITPAYSTLNLNKVEKIYALNPDLKIIFVMRDPLDRAWSGVMRYFLQTLKRDIREISNEKYLKQVNTFGNLSRTNYIRTLSIWETVFPKDQIHLDFFDNLKEDPEAFILRIYNFIGVNSDRKFISKKLHKAENSAGNNKIIIPQIVAREVAKNNVTQLEELSKRFGGHTTNWLKRAQKILSEGEDL